MCSAAYAVDLGTSTTRTTGPSLASISVDFQLLRSTPRWTLLGDNKQPTLLCFSNRVSRPKHKPYLRSTIVRLLSKPLSNKASVRLWRLCPHSGIVWRATSGTWGKYGIKVVLENISFANRKEYRAGSLSDVSTVGRSTASWSTETRSKSMKSFLPEDLFAPHPDGPGTYPILHSRHWIVSGLARQQHTITYNHLQSLTCLPLGSKLV